MARKEWESAVGEPATNPADPDVLLGDKVSERRRRQIERQEELDEAKHTTTMAELKKKETSAEVSTEKAGEKKEESGFKVTGGMHLGNIDYQAMMQKQVEERDELRKEAEQAAANQQQISDNLRERLHVAEMQVLKTSFEAQMQLLTKMIEGSASKGGFAEQLTAAREMAKELGFSQGSPNGGTEMIQIELKKLDFEHQMAMRKMNKDDKSEERRWQLELRRLDDEREGRKAELAQREKRDELFANAPKYLGGAIAQGIIASQGKGGGVAEEAPAGTKAPRGKQGPHFEAGKGESGEGECPGCNQPIAIGSTARVAVCANCGEKVPIIRTDQIPAGEEE